MDLKDIYDERGWISRDPGVISYLTDLVQNTSSIKEDVEEIVPCEQSTGAGGGFHFSGIHSRFRTPVLIKIGVNANELYWMQMIHEHASDLSPVLHASGNTLGSLEMGWTVVEQIDCKGMGPEWKGDEFTMLLDAAVRFQKFSRDIEPQYFGMFHLGMLQDWFSQTLKCDPPGPVESLRERIKRDFEWISSVCPFEICHGDIQMLNGLVRTKPPEKSPVLLIDCQPMLQPWAFDAGYLQVINSIDKKRAGYKDLITKMNDIRRSYSLETCLTQDLEKLSKIILAWFAVRQWRRKPTWPDWFLEKYPDYIEETKRYIEEGLETS